MVKPDPATAKQIKYLLDLKVSPKDIPATKDEASSLIESIITRITDKQRTVLRKYYDDNEIPEERDDASEMIQAIMFIGACARQRFGSSRCISDAVVMRILNTLDPIDPSETHALCAGSDGRMYPPPNSRLAARVYSCFEEFKPTPTRDLLLVRQAETADYSREPCLGGWTFRKTLMVITLLALAVAAIKACSDSIGGVASSNRESEREWHH